MKPFGGYVQGHLDFEGLASALLKRARELLPSWLPGGRINGSEFECGDLSGQSGQSLKINVHKGVWKDFASGEGGSDLISLFAAIEGISQGEAAKTLADQLRFDLTAPKPGNGHSRDEHRQENHIAPPPIGSPVPKMEISRLGGLPTKSWCYRSPGGAPLFYVARYDPPQERKQFLPWSWDTKRQAWIQKAWPQPRPLYGLELLAQDPSKPVLITEGEKACDAAREITNGKYVCVTWPNGSKAFQAADWRPIYGRRVLIWPDADKPGLECARSLADLLFEHCPEIKIIDVSDIETVGWDAADSNFTWEDMLAWAKPRAHIYARTETALVPEVLEAESPPDHPVNVSINISAEAADELPISVHLLHEELGIQKSQAGIPITNLTNAVRILEGWREFQDLAWFDEFYGKILTKWGSGKEREWDENDDLRLTHIVQSQFGIPRFSDEIVSKAIRHYAFQRKRNDPKDWMESLTWDGVPRIETFFQCTMSAEDTDYAQAVSNNFWISLVARVYSPGCQSDHMVVLEGSQGLGKSSAIREIGGRWAAELNESVSSKDFAQALQGKFLLEISELDAFNYAETETIKKVISCPVDRYRPSYGRYSKDFPRRCIFIGTTNQDEYLRDATGARRFWPIKTGEIDLALIREIREQCFAEAVSRYKAGESWHEVPKEQALAEQEARRQVDVWESVIADYLEGRSSDGPLLPRSEVTIHEVAMHLGFEKSARVDKGSQMRIGKVLRSLGWARIVSRDGRDVRRVWSRPTPF